MSKVRFTVVIWSLLSVHRGLGVPPPSLCFAFLFVSTTLYRLVSANASPFRQLRRFPPCGVYPLLKTTSRVNKWASPTLDIAFKRGFALFKGKRPKRGSLKEAVRQYIMRLTKRGIDYERYYLCKVQQRQPARGIH